MTNDEPLIDTDGAALMLGVSPRTVQEWVRRRRIPFVKLGEGRRALTRFEPPTLRAWIAAQRIEPTSKDESEGENDR